MGTKWLFVQKETKTMRWWDIRLEPQGFTHRPAIDYDDAYSHVMSVITFWYLIPLVVQINLSMQLVDVVTAYLYGSLGADVYMKVSDGLHIPNSEINRNMYYVKL